MTKFNTFNLPEGLLHRLEHIGFKEPTPVQEQAIPHALEGKDILGSAQTGTGKTGAFGIPLVANLMENNRGSALILLPTRELAVQVMAALQQFLGKTKVKTALLIGGEPMPKQFSQLRANPRLIVGTPGRVNDHLERGTLKLHDTQFLVLDEVDRMLDMGFGIQLDAIARYLTSPKRQTLMFSATLPSNIEKLSSKYLTDPIRISVGTTHSPAEKVKQEHAKLADNEKYPRLLEELEARNGSVIIFVKTKHGADRMAGKLKQEGHKVDALHGDLRQNKRNYVITGFRKKKFNVLVATDVAARGLDIPHIEHVINYDMPQNAEDYIHRIGRTARAGAEGNAMNFISPADGQKWRAVQRLLNPNATFPKEPSKGKGQGKGKKGGYNPFKKFGNKKTDSKAKPQHWKQRKKPEAA